MTTSIGNLGILINQAGDPCTKGNLDLSNQQIRSMSLQGSYLLLGYSNQIEVFNILDSRKL